jgi:regulator of extracellular matrix RemA (YlzA/DUF370 family)
MDLQLIKIGFGNLVSAKQVLAILSPDSAPIKRIINAARENQRLVDETQGRRARAVIITQASATDNPGFTFKKTNFQPSLDDNPIFLSYIQPETIARRFVIDQNTFPQNFYSARDLVCMDIQLINIGFGNIVSANRVVAIVSPESAPIKRIITEAREGNRLIDATYGRRTRAVIVMDSSHVILSAIQPETVANRFVAHKDGHGS